MRTTLELDDKIHELARRRAFEERRSLGEVVSELALKGLAAERLARPARRLGLFDGKIFVAPDFDETPPEVIEALEESPS